MIYNVTVYTAHPLGPREVEAGSPAEAARHAITLNPQDEAIEVTVGDTLFTADGHPKNHSKCPVCGSTQIEGASFDVECEFSVTQECNCLDCDARWRAVYELQRFIVRKETP
jgi:hypothetical protein